MRKIKREHYIELYKEIKKIIATAPNEDLAVTEIEILFQNSYK